MTFSLLACMALQLPAHAPSFKADNVFERVVISKGHRWKIRVTYGQVNQHKHQLKYITCRGTSEVATSIDGQIAWGIALSPKSWPKKKDFVHIKSLELSDKGVKVQLPSFIWTGICEPHLSRAYEDAAGERIFAALPGGGVRLNVSCGDAGGGCQIIMDVSGKHEITRKAYKETHLVESMTYFSKWLPKTRTGLSFGRSSPGWRFAYPGSWMFDHFAVGVSPLTPHPPGTIS